MKYLLLILPLAACGTHVDRCVILPLPPECTQSGGDGLALFAGDNVPPRPDHGPAPAPEPPAPGPEPKPDHHDDDEHEDHDDHYTGPDLEKDYDDDREEHHDDDGRDHDKDRGHDKGDHGKHGDD